ncbi:hypothetical protein BN159_5030 [Streptomyces davaonensis JCM 4913]|uniref:Uncharacterized protein n=2 Tax=Streptomyces davaonensis TaxID=348043 RepID=K4R9Q8_STRDJ|nr:hypothetical protein BN159_5030 [Streptomyces davaonensis JCM 4913]
MQELIGRRKRAGFVGRGAELARFRENLDLPPDDDRHSFLFHVHGTGGVGKSSLLGKLAEIATAAGALTATLDETVQGVPEVLGAISAQFAVQGAELPELDKKLAAYRQRRQEAESAWAEPDADPDARFRTGDDVQLALEPLKVLTPVLVSELNRIAERRSWIALFFDTYERTGPFLDAWLLDLTMTGRYGTLPANTVVTLAGREGPDPARWGDYAGFVTEFPLEPFTEPEARELLSAKGLVEEGAVREVLRLSHRLPLLVSILAEQPGGAVGEADDPTATAVERFLKWERDPGRREAALACAFPRRLDGDVFEVAVQDAGEGSYGWLCELSFVSERAGGARYHDVVRTAMLRLQRSRAPRLWAGRHARLAEAYGRWRADAGDGIAEERLWFDGTWRELRAEELYHLLCARPRAALSQALADVVEACREDLAAAGACARALADAGADAGANELSVWGRELLDALSGESGGILATADLVLNRPGPDTRTRAAAHALRGRELTKEGEFARAIDECNRALALDPQSAWVFHDRGVALAAQGDVTAALADLEQAEALRPDDVRILINQQPILQMLGRHEDVVAGCDRVIALDPMQARAWANRGQSRHALGDSTGALSDFDRALSIEGDYLWALVRRSRVYRSQGRLDESFADLDRAVDLAPASAWLASERGDAYRLVDRFEEAVRELGRACELVPDYASAHAGRGYALAELGRHEEARAAYDRAIELNADYPWALVHRASLKGELGDQEGMFTDLDRAVAIDGSGWAIVRRAAAHQGVGHHAEALADVGRAEELGRSDPELLVLRAGILYRLGRTVEAVTLLDQAWPQPDRTVALNPRDVALYALRIGMCLTLGRLPQALADAEQFDPRDLENPGMVQLSALVFILSGRHDEARRLLDGLWEDAAREENWPIAQLCWLSAAVAGRWDQASGIATWMRDHADPVSVPPFAETEEFRPFEPLFRSHPQRTDNADMMIAYARGEWAAADSALADILARTSEWLPLAQLANYLRILAHCPGVDWTQLASRVREVENARDAVQARYAE